MKSILIVVTDGFEDLEAIAPFAILNRAKEHVTFASLYSTSATGRFGLKSVDMKMLKDVNYKEYDALVIPGGPEYIAEEKDENFKNMIREFYEEGKVVAAICAGPTILGHMGLLKNKKYTCFTSMNEDFGGEYVDKYVVVDGNLITGRSAAASIDFAFAILEKLEGEKYSEKIKESIYY